MNDAITTQLLAGAPVDAHTRIKNPALSDVLNDILLNQAPEAYFQKLIPTLVGFGFMIGVIVFFFYLLFGAIKWIVSGGDKAAVESARSSVMQAVVGLVILFSAFALVKVIEIIFQTDILKLDIGGLKIE